MWFEGGNSDSDLREQKLKLKWTSFSSIGIYINPYFSNDLVKVCSRDCYRDCYGSSTLRLT